MIRCIDYDRTVFRKHKYESNNHYHVYIKVIYVLINSSFGI